MKTANKSIIFLFLVPLLGPACQNYGLVEKLESPGGAQNGKGAGQSVVNQIFITTGVFNGNLGGIAGADALCLNDGMNPLGPGVGIWKAMLSATSVRVACITSDCSGSGLAEHIDWVFAPNTTYYRTDGTPIGTSNANGLFVGSLQNSPQNTSSAVFTGLTTNWVVAGTHCLSWSSSTLGDNGQSGQTDQTGILWFSNTSIGCDVPSKRLYCVQQ